MISPRSYQYVLVHSKSKLYYLFKCPHLLTGGACCSSSLSVDAVTSVSVALASTFSYCSRRSNRKLNRNTCSKSEIAEVNSSFCIDEIPKWLAMLNSLTSVHHVKRARTEQQSITMMLSCRFKSSKIRLLFGRKTGFFVNNFFLRNNSKIVLFTIIFYIKKYTAAL